MKHSSDAEFLVNLTEVFAGRKFHEFRKLTYDSRNYDIPKFNVMFYGVKRVCEIKFSRNNFFFFLLFANFET